MRIPFDLIAAVLCLEGMGRYLATNTAPAEVAAVRPGVAAAAWCAFLLAVWLMHELVTRRSEWRTRFGQHVAGFGRGPHPMESHAWGVRIAQAITVLLYTGLLWALKWPLYAERWPLALGFSAESHIGALPLKESSVIALPLCLAPFLLAMVASWIPRRRLVAGLRGREVPLLAYLGYEARLTWLPVILGFILAVFRDALATLPAGYTAWLEAPGVDLLSVIAMIAFISLVGLPMLVVWLWRCKPMPEGELKDRLWALVQRSGVKARGIMVWGPRSTGLLNACVLGGWARYRYVLISPALVDELSPAETEAVLAHELGHARHGHLVFLFVMILCLSALLDPIQRVLPEAWRASPLIEIGVLISFITAYMYLFYGAIMRQCEREADLASAELLGTAVPLIMALEKLALITGNIRNVWCWHHGSIAERVAAVNRLSQDPDGSRKFHRRLRLMRVMFAVFTLVALGAELCSRLL
ncbi:MAG: M48 family metallopeptidase [Planctomycetota bacterium]|nr:M48 family metallopeptidase [Planctomycetota bacterium]